MRKRAAVDAVGMALLASLGLLSGCGGSVNAGDDGGGPGPNGEGAAPGPNGEGAAPGPGGTCSLHPCVRPTPLVVGGVDTGYETCQGGPLRRRAIVDCPSLVPRTAPSCPLPDGGNAGGCTSDSDCTYAPNGFCQYSSGVSGAGPYCFCAYGCLRDSDCASGSICVCGDPVGQCEQASCSSNSACGPGCDCIGPSPYAFTCQTPTDNCIADSDCQGTPLPDAGTFQGGCSYLGQVLCAGPQYSAAGPDAGLHCAPAVVCVTGRPFLVHGSERLATVAARGDWRTSRPAPDTRAVPASVRARLSEHWARTGLMEHASIAAFARFTLHLLAVGAPPDLVALSQAAMGDETEHARLAFSLASAYAGAELGPGRLAIDGSLDGFTVAEMCSTLIAEGCIGETVAAIEAREALDGAGDPAVQGVLETIARDELRHAELAWRTLGWLVASGHVRRSAVREAVASGLRSWKEARGCSRPADSCEDLRSFGVVSDTRRDAARLASAMRVIAACAAALVDGPAVLPRMAAAVA